MRFTVRSAQIRSGACLQTVDPVINGWKWAGKAEEREEKKHTHTHVHTLVSVDWFHSRGIIRNTTYSAWNRTSLTVPPFCFQRTHHGKGNSGIRLREKWISIGSSCLERTTCIYTLFRSRSGIVDSIRVRTRKSVGMFYDTPRTPLHSYNQRYFRFLHGSLLNL